MEWINENAPALALSLLFAMAFLSLLWMYKQQDMKQQILMKVNAVEHLVYSDLLKRIISSSDKIDYLKEKISEVEENILKEIKDNQR